MATAQILETIPEQMLDPQPMTLSCRATAAVKKPPARKNAG